MVGESICLITDFTSIWRKGIFIPLLGGHNILKKVKPLNEKQTNHLFKDGCGLGMNVNFIEEYNLNTFICPLGF